MSNEYLTIFALLAGPVIAVQLQKFIEKTSEAKKRKEWIFKTLMATRGALLSFDHVAALNRIDLEFSNSNKYKKVLEAWKLYLDNLFIKTESEQATLVWNEKNSDLLADLLYEMSRSLGYDFEKSLIKRNIYYPRGHGIIERENQLIRDKLISILEGQSSFPINISDVALNEEATNRQRQLQELLIEYYTRENKKGD